MAIKAFPTIAVAGAYTGCLLEKGKFGDIHEVFDHFYPGIMTLGLASMSKTVSAHLAKVIPRMTELPDVTPENYQDVARLAVEMFGPTIELDGPLADVNPLALELDYLDKRAPDKPVVVVTPPGPRHD